MAGDEPPKAESEAANVLPFRPPTRPTPGNGVEPPKQPSLDPRAVAQEAAAALVDGLYGSVGYDRMRADWAAIEDPAVFRRRFWFVVNETRRRMIVKYQRLADLTDREVTLLHYTSTLDLEDDTPRITARRELWVFGKSVAVFFALLATVAFIAVVNQPTRSWGHFLPLVFGELLLAFLIHGAQLWWVRPWTLRRRVERHLAKSA